MLRLIISRKWKDSHSCLETNTFETVDVDAPELEKILRGGGYGESGYDYRSVVGVELLEPAQRTIPE